MKYSKYLFYNCNGYKVRAPSALILGAYVQKNLDAIVNKKVGELFIEADYMGKLGSDLMLFRYGIQLSKDASGKYMISHEELSVKKATSKNDSMEKIFEAANGEIVFIYRKVNSELLDMITKKTANLLATTSMCALFFEKIFVLIFNKSEGNGGIFSLYLFTLYYLGKKMHVYLDQSDDHRDYLIDNSFGYLERNNSNMDSLMKHFVEMDSDPLDIISVSKNYVLKRSYEHFEKTVEKLCEFLKIFKSDLQNIEIDKKEDHDLYICSLVMVYESYKIHAEFESTGVKKLIKLFAYLKEMVQGGIVFIDEFDSNLHDVYLCALLEYLMEYGEGQLCFTTHNVGPMDILKQHKKSIDFLSADHKIYPWTTNGNYSPSKLYRNGMIEGSPFNVDSIDFIGVFSSEEEDD